MSATTERVLAAARKHIEEAPALLRRWIAINSYSRNVAGANAMADALERALALPELRIRRRPGREVGDHLLAHTDAWSRPDAAGVLLVGHHDTVFPPGAFEDCELRGSRLHGPGAVDMKGGLVVMRTALAALSDAGMLDALPLALISVADEEIGSGDSRPFLEECARRASAACVLELGRPGDAIVTRRKGAGAATVQARGRSAHAGNDHASGISAIRALARFIDAAESLTDPAAGRTVNVGVVAGGETRNSVPEQARCEVDFRFERAGEGEGMIAELDRLCRESGAASGAELALEAAIHHPAWERSADSDRLRRQYGRCAERAGLSSAEAPLVGGGSDANLIGALGVPTIDGLGPRGGGLHTKGEWVDLDSLAPKTEALLRFLVELGTQAS